MAHSEHCSLCCHSLGINIVRVGDPVFQGICVSWLILSACSLMHPCLYVYKHEWKSPNVSSASVFVGVHICTNACMCVCLYIYIYNSYLRISAAQWSCISQLWHFHFEKHRWIFSFCVFRNDTHCTLCFQDYWILSVVAPEQATVHITPRLPTIIHSILAFVATSVSLLLATIE